MVGNIFKTLQYFPFFCLIHFNRFLNSLTRLFNLSILPVRFPKFNRSATNIFSIHFLEQICSATANKLIIH